MAKLIGTANASGFYADFGTGRPETALDGKFETGWSSQKTYNATAGELFALIFDQPVTPKRFEFWMNSWGRSIQIGYADTFSTSKTDYTILRSIDTVAADSAGRPWVGAASNRSQKNIIALPDNTVAARVWMFSTVTMGSTIYVGSMGSTATNTSVDRLRIREVDVYDTLTQEDGRNPKVPGTQPVAPWTATPAFFKRTEFLNPGNFSFTPDPDTTAIMVIAQGAGGGGIIQTLKDDSANTVPAGPGGATIVRRTNGDQLIAANGGSAPTAGQATFPTISDWLKPPATLAASNGSTVAGFVSAAGGSNSLGANGGTGFTYEQTSKIATVNFRDLSDNTLPPTANSGWVRDTTYGWRSNNKSHNSSSYVIFASAPYLKSQQISFSWGVSSENTYDKLTIRILLPSGQSTDWLVVSGVQSSTSLYTIPSDGMYGFQFIYTKDSSNSSGLDQAWVGGVVSSVGYRASSLGGGAGGAASLLMLAEPLEFSIGAGGVGSPADHAVTSAQNGTKGSGGAGGGNGGNGAVIVYEYKGLLTYDSPLQYNLTNFNVAPVEMQGIYRTDYVGQGVSTTQNYVHKLRPRTRNVLVLMAGCGGGNAQIVNIAYPQITNDPAIVAIGARRYTAGSGSSSYRETSGSYWGAVAGRGGMFVSDDETIWRANGSFSSYPANLTAIFSSYGSSREGTWANGNTASQTYSGGSGAAALIFAGGDALGDRTITIQVPGAGDGPGVAYAQGYPGVVVIYETESDIGPYTTQISQQTLVKDVPHPDTLISQTSEQVLVKEKQVGTRITQNNQQVLVKEKQVGTQITQVAEQVLIRESDNANNPLQISYAAMAYIIDAPDPTTAITQNNQQVLLRDKQGPTNSTQLAQQILLKAFPATFRFTQVTQQILVAENPSVFFMNFGNLEYPLKNYLYDSREARATSVPDGAYIQLEGAFAEGSYMVVNGVNVGLSSPVKNNDRVQLHSGVTNYWQLSINVYAYYMVNGEVTREMVGRWNIIQPELSPQKPRAYSVYYTNKQWLITKTKYSTGTITSIFTKARTALSNVMQVLVGKGNTALANARDAVYNGANTSLLDAIKPVKSAAQFAVYSMQSKASQVYHRLAAGMDSIVTKTYAKEADASKFSFIQATDAKHGITFDSGVGVGAQYYEMDVQQSQAGFGDLELVGFEALPPATNLYENMEFIDSPLGTGATDLAFDPLPLGSTVPVDQDFDYVQVGKSYSDTQEYEAMLTTGFASTFEMGFTDTIAYSVLNSFDFVGVRSGGTGFWIVPLDTADITRPKMSLMQMFPAEKSHNHTEFVQQTPEAHGAHEFYNFSTTPIFAGAPGNATFTTGIIRRVEHAVPVQIGWVRVKAQMGVYKNTPYRPAQIATGRGNASLYQGFDTHNDVLDFTANYSGVTTLQKFNGYVYNLDVDKTFVCEVYYNGPISGLMQGG